MSELSESKSSQPALAGEAPFSATENTAVSRQREIVIGSNATAPGMPVEVQPPLDEAGDALADAALGDAALANAEPMTHSPPAAVDPRLLESQQTVVSKKPPIPVAAPTTLFSPAELGSRLQGTMLGHFRLEEFVGGGGMGAVFRAVDTMLGRTVAVKVLSRDSTDDETRRRFQNEAESAARLDHENIARVYYVGADKGLHYIVFEYIEGVNIRDLVEHKGPLPIEEAINYTLQVAEALEHASKREVVHRDIKPSNVLVTAEGKAKLVDMGLARLHQLQSDSRDITASGVTLGTFDYISPEQARDPRIADVRSDLYSLGCTVYFMLTGRPPFPEGTVLQKLLSHSSEPPADPRTLRPDLDDGLVAIVNRLLAKQPVQRFQQPSELIGELLLVAERLDLSNITRRGTVWITPTKTASWMLERHLPWVAPIALLLVGVFAVELFSGNDEPADFAWQRPVLAGGELQPRDGAAEGAADGAAMPDSERPADPPAELPAPVDANAAATPPAAEPANTNPAHAKPTNGNSPNGAATISTGNGAATPLANAESSTARPPQPPSGTGTEAAAESIAAKPAAAAVATAPDPAPPLTKPGESKPSESPLPPTNQPASEIASANSKPSSAPVVPPTSPTPATPGGTAAEAVAAASPSQMPDEAAVAKPARIVVGASDLPIAADTLLVSSLATACQEAAARKVELIELQFQGVREEPPVKIAAQRLTIRAAAGFQPTIVFRPGLDDLTPTRHLIDLGGGDVTWQGVHVRLELPREPASGWSLFQLRRVVSLNVSDSVLTIRNADSNGRSLHDEVAFFQIEPPARSMGMDGDASENGEPRPMLLPPHIGLENCVVRGQATVFRGDQATPFRVVCQNSLLITCERFLDFGGVSSRPRIQDGRIDVVLKHVTASLGQGMYRLSTRDDAAHQLELVSDCRESILYVTDGSAPLIERRGGSNANELGKRLYVRGRDNFYPGSMTLLRIGSGDNSAGGVDFDFERGDDDWYTEESPRFSLMWRRLPASDLSADKHSPADYLLAENQNNPAILSGDTKAGADISRLPQPPDDPIRPAAAVSP